jgi:hypothetical protein
MGPLPSMGLIQGAFLFSLAALAIPVLLHLFSRWQSQRIELGTIRFLREVLTESTSRRKIRRWLLLITRMLMLAALAMLFARPYLLEPTRRDGDRRRVILIDRSASMGMRGNQGKAIDIAIGKGMEAAKELGSDARVDWAWFDSTVHPFEIGEGRISASMFEASDTNQGVTNQSGEPGTTRSESAKDGQRTHGHTSYVAALTWARDRIAADGRAKSDVVLITDLQRRGLGEPIDIDFPSDIPVKIVDVGRDAASNLAIMRMELSATPSKRVNKSSGFASESSKSAVEPVAYVPALHGKLRPDQSIFVQVTFFNYGPLQREDVPLVVTAKQGTKSARVKTTINAAPEQASESRIELGTLGVGQWEIMVEADVDDDLASDNRRLHGVAVELPPRVLVAADRDPKFDSLTGDFYLVKAIQQGIQRDQPRFESMVVQPNSIGNTLSNQSAGSVWDTLVLADATNVDASTIRAIEEFVRGGGHVLAFVGPLGGEMGAALWNDSPLAPGRFGAVQSAGVVPFRLRPTDLSHAILKPFEDPQAGDLQRLAFRKAISIQQDPSAVQLASFDRDLPGMVERECGKGRIVWFLSDAGEAWSNWTSSPLYLPLVQQMVADLAGLSGEGPIRFRAVGDERGRSIASTNSNANATNADQPRIRPVSLTIDPKPKSTSQAAVAFESTGFVHDDQSLYVINTLESESDTARLSELELRKAFSLSEPQSTKQGTVGKEVQTIKKYEAWPWIAGLLLMLLVFEFGLSNRTPP